MEPPGFQVEEGQGVMVSGTVKYEGDKTGTYRMDFLRPPGEGQRPGAVHTMSIEGQGEWSVEVPKDFGELAIVAFVDVNDDGPSPDEPKVVLEKPIEVGSEPITGIEMVVQDDWDLNHKPPNGQRMRPGQGKAGGQPGQQPPPGEHQPGQEGSPAQDAAPAQEAMEGEQPA